MKWFEERRERWLRRRDQRVTGLGGMPFQQADAPLPARRAFRPTPVDRAGHLKKVEMLADQLAPGTDEQTGYALDNLINAWHEAWEHETLAEFAGFQVDTSLRLGRVEPLLAQYRNADVYMQQRLLDAKTATEAARQRLVGEITGDKPHHEPQDQPETGRPTRGRLGFTAWGGATFADPTLLAGRSRGTFLHVVVLLVAAGADAAAFLQVMQLLLRKLPPFASGLIVAGLTVTALYLSHHAGVLIRHAVAGSRASRWWIAVSMFLWLALGMGAAAIRYFFTHTTGTAQIAFGQTASSGGGDEKQRAGVAAVFLLLYLATGLVAALGGYLTDQPARSAYARAMRNLRSCTEIASASGARLSRAEAERSLYAEELMEARHKHVAELGTRAALAEELKQMVRFHHARHAQDPSATNELFDRDHRPHWRETS